MSDARTKESHEERTAHEPRDMTLHDVILAHVEPVGRLVRLFRLEIPAGQPDFKFLPGQWVDCFVPGVAKAGGFTITSTPAQAAASPENNNDRHVELAVKASPENPAAAWLWQDPVSAILGQTLRLRAGGRFVFPPPGLQQHYKKLARIVFVAGGVGINPLISMLSHLGEVNKGASSAKGPEVVFLYSVREEQQGDNNDGDLGSRILFLPRLASLFDRGSVRGRLQLFLTGGRSSSSSSNINGVPCERRRLTAADVDAAVVGGLDTDTDTDRDNVYVYVCGVPTMTDALVAHLTGSTDSGGLGLAAHQVLYERWW